MPFWLNDFHVTQPGIENLHHTTISQARQGRSPPGRATTVPNGDFT
jgi:hypothetical protein